MALKKPSDYFNKNNSTVNESTISNGGNSNSTEILNEFTNTLSTYRTNIEKVDNLSNQVEEIKTEIENLLKKEDLDNALVSQLLVVDDIVGGIQSKVKSINEKKLSEIRLDVSELTDTVNEFIEVEVPKYKKLVVESEIRSNDRYEELEENVSQTLNAIGEFVDEKYQELTESLQGINSQNLSQVFEDFKNLENIIKEFKQKDIPKYKSFIVETERKTESKLQEFEETLSDKLEETYSEFKSLDDKFNELKEEDIPSYRGFIVEADKKNQSRLEEFQEQLNETIFNITEKVSLVEGDKDNLVEVVNQRIEDIKSLMSQVNLTKEDVEKQKVFIKKKVSDLEVDILRNENHIKVQNENLQSIQEEVKQSLKKINVEEIQKQNHKLGEKIKYLEEVFNKFNEKEILTENIIVDTPSTDNKDPLTPLDQNFVTLDQLQQHYRLFINRIQQQLASIGGGGETRLEFLDDVNRDSVKVDGKFLKYDSATDKWIGADAGSSLTVTEVPSQGGAATTSVTNVTEIQFNNGAGFSVSDEGSGVAFVDLGSTFNPWYVDGQDVLKATGEEPIEFIAGAGIAITTKAVASVGIGTTFSKAITISSNLASSPWVDANPGIYTTGNVAIGTDTVGSGSTVLWVEGDARITGILSVGQGTITIDGTTNTINVENLSVTNSINGPGGAGIASEGYVDTSIANLIDTAPSTLDTLNELAAALGDDPNFATTVTNSLSLKAPINNANLTGVTTTSTLNVTGNTNVTGIITATSFSGSGTNLTGIVTSIIAGTNITIDPVGGTGAVTINSTASGGGVSDSYLGLEVTDGSESEKSILAMYARNPRGNGMLYNWTTNGPKTTFYTYGGNGSNDAEQGSWLIMNNFRPSDTYSNTYGERISNQELVSSAIKSNGNWIGNIGAVHTYPRQTSNYTPISVLLMPIRNNHPSLTKSVTIYGVYANQYTTYDGSSLWQFAPNTNGTYNISSGTWTRLQFRQSASSYGYTWTSTISIPPSTTHCVMQMTSNYYYTSNGGYWFLDWNAFYNLDVTFADNYIEVDPRLIETLRFADFRKYGMTSTSVDNFYRTYTAAASLYGDR